MIGVSVVKTETSRPEIAVGIGDESPDVLQRLRQFARARREPFSPVVLHAILVVPVGTFLRHPNVAVIVLHVPVHVPAQSHQGGPKGPNIIIGRGRGDS